MQTRDALALYARALSLIPDEAAAADLCLRCRDEADLYRLAARWRRARSLPPAQPGAPLPALDLHQQEMALHLAHRRRRRREQGWGLATVAGLILLVVALFWTRLPLPGGSTALPAGETYIGAPLSRSAQVAGHRLAIFRAEAVPGALTVWWEVTGPRAAEMAPLARQSILLTDVGPADAEEVVAHRKERLVGRSVFRVLNPAEQLGLTLVLGGSGERAVAYFEPAFLEQDPAAHTYVPAHELILLHGQKVTVERVTAGPYATTVRLRFPERMGVRFPDVLADGKPLGRGGTWRPTHKPPVYEMVLEPVPPGTTSLQIRYSTDDFTVTEEVVNLPAPDLMEEWRVEEKRVVAVLRYPVVGSQPLMGIARDNQDRPVYVRIRRLTGDRWELEIDLLALGYNAEKNEWHQQHPITADDLVALHLGVPRTAPAPEVVIPLR